MRPVLAGGLLLSVSQVAELYLIIRPKRRSALEKLSGTFLHIRGSELAVLRLAAQVGYRSVPMSNLIKASAVRRCLNRYDDLTGDRKLDILCLAAQVGYRSVPISK